MQGRIGRHDFPVALPPAIEFVAFGDSPLATQAMRQAPAWRVTEMAKLQAAD